MKTVISALAAVVIFGVNNANADVVEDLYKSRAQYHREVTKAKSELEDALSDLVKKAAETGDLKEVKAAIAEIEAFADDGILPSSKASQSATKKYRASRKAAFLRIKKSYEDAISSYTKELRVKEAERLQEELEELSAREYSATDSTERGSSPQSKQIDRIVKTIREFMDKFGALETDAQRNAELKDFLDSTNKTLRNKKIYIRVPVKNVHYSKKGSSIELGPPDLGGAVTVRARSSSFSERITVQLSKSRALAIRPNAIIILRGRPQLSYPRADYREAEYWVKLEHKVVLNLYGIQERFVRGSTE